MNYKLKSVNGKVTFLLRTGKDLVKNPMWRAIPSISTISGTLRGSLSTRLLKKQSVNRRLRNENLSYCLYSALYALLCL